MRLGTGSGSMRILILLHPNLRLKGKRDERVQGDEKTKKKKGAPIRGIEALPEKGWNLTKYLSMGQCPHCNHDLGEPIKTETKLIEDLPPPRKIKVTQFDTDVYRCPNCGAEVRGKHEDCPQVGTLGVYLLVYITMLKYHLRGPVRKVRDFLYYDTTFEIRPKGVMDGLLRVGDACKNGYEDMIQRIRRSRWVYADETGMKANGKKWWLWIL